MIGAEIRRRVRERAGNRCEYLHIRQADEPFINYQVEHIIARQHGGGNEEENLALACSHCNLHKGPNLAGIDPTTGDLEPFFSPRRRSWDEHFEDRGIRIEGMTPCGRATVRVLAMNAQARVDLRQELAMSEDS